MIRERLIATVEEAVEGLGYTFFTGNDPMLGAIVNTFPAAWISPLKINSIEGHNDCKLVYHLSINMIMLANSPQIGHEALWQIMECDSIELFNILFENEWISDVKNFKCTPLQKALTKCGDVSICAEMDIETFYCN